MKVLYKWWEVPPRPIESGDLAGVEVTPVRDQSERPAWRILVDRCHYLGDGQISGEHRLYFARLAGEIVGCISWSAAALHCPLRDVYVGWDFATRRHRLHLVASNQRFLILPWVKIKGLGSRILGLNLRLLSADWKQAYGHPVALVETFVDVSHFTGTVYRASHWMFAGTTSGGRRKSGHTYEVQYAPMDVRTISGYSGLVVPIPTLPALSTTSLVCALVSSRTCHFAVSSSRVRRPAASGWCCGSWASSS